MLMFRCKSNSTKEHYIIPSDPFLYTIYNCILMIIVLAILIFIVLVLRLPGFILYAVLGFVIAAIFLSGAYTNKIAQLNDLYYLFGMMMIGFIGVDLCAQNLMLALTWITLFAFVAYLTVIYKDVKRGYVGLLVTFMPVVLNMRYPLGILGGAHNNLQVILTDVISIVILFSLILIFALFYPMRYRTTSLIASIECVYLVRNILNKYAGNESFSDIRLQLNTFLEKLDLNINQLSDIKKNKKLKSLLKDHYAMIYHLELLLTFGFETNTLSSKVAEQYKDKMNNLLDGKYRILEENSLILADVSSDIENKVMSDLNRLMHQVFRIYPLLIEQRKRYA